MVKRIVFLSWLLFTISCGESLEDKSMRIFGTYLGQESSTNQSGSTTTKTMIYKVEDYIGSPDSILIIGDWSRRVYLDGTCTYSQNNGRLFRYTFVDDGLNISYQTGGNAFFSTHSFRGRKI